MISTEGFAPIKRQDRKAASIERMLKLINKELPKIEKDAKVDDNTFEYQTLLWNFRKKLHDLYPQ